MYLLDTDICSYLQTSGYPALQSRFRTTPASDVAISSVTHAEIWFGLARRNVGMRRRMAAGLFLDSVQSLDWPTSAARTYGEVRARLENAGTRLQERDLMIAAHAIAIDATLVTNNTRHFSRIGPPLKLENWLDPQV